MQPLPSYPIFFSMTKVRTSYVCSQCGNDSPKWIGKCPVCGEWNTYSEYIAPKTSTRVSSRVQQHASSKPLSLKEITTNETPRLDLNDHELNRVLGGGLVAGSMVLLGGEPGIGKSTLVLQTVLSLSSIRTLYISGEESAQQIKMRANRLNPNNQSCQILCETHLEQILLHLKEVKPEMVIIDSIQTVFSQEIDSTPGSVSQVRECATAFLKFAKDTNTPIILIGHINKDGNIAGPKVLEHIVDAVIQFEGDQHHLYRVLRNIKNRFGSTAEVGIYEMKQNGLRQVNNPSELLLSHNHEGLSGISIAATVEGIRPFLIETQALVSTAAYGTPQRSATGFDIRRMNMLLAVLEKKAGFKIAQKDVFLNIAGGIKVNDPAIDMSILSAILSSNLDIPIAPSYVVTGEVGLSGEVRPVNRIEQRISEAKKLGFTKIIIPHQNKKELTPIKGIEIIPVKKIEEAFQNLFG